MKVKQTYQYATALFILFFSFNLTAQITLFDEDINSLELSSDHSRVQNTFNPLQTRFVNFAGFGEEQGLQLNLSDKIKYQTKHIRTERHPNGTSVWIGQIVDQPFSSVFFAETDGVWFGKIEDNFGNLFLLNSTQHSDVYALLQVEGAVEDEGKNCEQFLGEEIDSQKEKDNLVGICDAGSTCGTANVDILLLYTDDARLRLGGTNAAQSACATAVAEMNTISSNSNMVHTFTLVHTAEVDYVETDDSGIDLNRLRTNGDNQLDIAHSLRETYGADIVSLVTGSTYCGRGYINTNPNSYNSSAAFSVVRDNCMTGNKSLAHEVGHNMGLRHDRFTYDSTPSIACGFAYGYVNQSANGGSTNQRWRSVMAYNAQCVSWGFSCTRVPFWSNSNVNYTNNPMGKPVGTADEANTSYMLNRSICLVANFREQTFPNCQNNDLSINSPNIQTGAYSTKSNITSTGQILNGSDVTYTAGISITLGNNFRVDKGGKFEAKIQTCTAFSQRLEVLPAFNNVLSPTFVNRENKSFKTTPNPTQGEVNVSFNLLHSEEKVAIEIYNSYGQKVQTLMPSQSLIKGNHQLNFNINQLAAGIYWLSLSTAQHNQTRKLIVSK